MDGKKVLGYLENLSMNNERDWFHEESNQSLYQECRKEFVNFVESIHTGIQQFDKTMNGLETKQMIFRINRDVRFSKDKSPYKNNFGASITRDGGKKSPYSGYYLHIQPGNYSFLASGLYYPDKEVVDAFRLHLEYHGGDFEKILSNKLFLKEYKELLGRTLVRPPRGCTVDTPHLKLVKMKDWYATSYIKDEVVMGEGLYDHVISLAKVIHPFTKFINNPIQDLYA